MSGPRSNERADRGVTHPTTRLASAHLVVNEHIWYAISCPIVDSDSIIHRLTDANHKLLLLLITIVKTNTGVRSHIAHLDIQLSNPREPGKT